MDARDVLISILVQRLGGDVTINAEEFDAATPGKDLRVWQDLGALQYHLQVIDREGSVASSVAHVGRAELTAG